MGLLILLVGVGIALVALFTATQVILPYRYGTPLFPLFRGKNPLKEQVEAAEKELAEKTELVILNEQLEEINRRKAQLEERQNGNS